MITSVGYANFIHLWCCEYIELCALLHVLIFRSTILTLSHILVGTTGLVEIRDEFSPNESLAPVQKLSCLTCMLGELY